MSPEHRAVRRALIFKQRQPCYICGRTLDDFKGVGSALEIHHVWVEYAEYNNVDPDRVKADHPIFAHYNTQGAYDGVDAQDGSLVLCSLHHRGSKQSGRSLAEGIHNSDFGTWLMQKYVADDKLHGYMPGVVLIRKGVSDPKGYLPDFLERHPDLKAIAPRRA